MRKTMPRGDMQNSDLFETRILPHLDAAYNLARWLTKNGQDADDIVQEACLRALKYVESATNENGKSWMLKIVRNTYYTSLQKRSSEGSAAEPHLIENLQISEAEDPQNLMFQKIDIEQLHAAIEELPSEFREMIVLRELEEMSYEDISRIAAVPMGTVMSRLARARARLQQILVKSVEE